MIQLSIEGALILTFAIGMFLGAGVVAFAFQVHK